MESKKLCLLWQNQTTRQWYHVANLTLTNDGRYSFYYENKKEKRGLVEALNHGYRLFPSFSDANKVYTSMKLFSVFSRRLPNKARPDYYSLLENNDLDSNSSEFEILTMTGGRLVSDNYEFVKPIQFEKECFYFDFYVRGWRHWNSEDKKIHNFDSIYFEADKNNEKDKDAVAVKDTEGIIGYVPAFYSEFMAKVLEANVECSIVEGEFNEKALSPNKVRLKVVGKEPKVLFSQKDIDLLVTV